jgi:WhiB family redox-sensing transcriptional regulator
MENWFKKGNCYGKDTSMFYPETGDISGAKKAKILCTGCPVRAECLAYALNNNELFGVWGGMTVRKRKKLRSRISIPCDADDCRKLISSNESV